MSKKNLMRRRKLAKMIRADLSIYLIYLSTAHYNEVKAKSMLDIAMTDLVELSQLDSKSGGQDAEQA